MNSTGSVNSSYHSIKDAGPPKSTKSSTGNSKATSIRSGSTYEHSQEPFETYKLKAVQLCKDIGFGEPVEVTRMEGGSFNRVIGCTAKDKKAVLRIPRAGSLRNDGAEKISDQVSVLQYLVQFNFLHVPTILAYDTTEDNALESRYVLQERIQGTAASLEYYDLPVAERLEIASLVADLLIKMESISFGRPGRIAGTQTLVPSSKLSSKVESDIRIAGLRQTNISDMPVVEKQPLISLLVLLFDFRKQGTRQAILQSMFSKLQVIAQEMDKAGLFCEADSENFIWHWDFEARNILIDRMGKAPAQQVRAPGCQHSISCVVGEPTGHGAKHTIQVTHSDDSSQVCKHKVEVAFENDTGKTYRHTFEISDKGQREKPVENVGAKWTISGVLDWDDVRSAPKVLSRSPPSWLWYNDEERSGGWTGGEDAPPERDLTTDEILIKAHFDQIMARASPSYMDDAYHRGIWIRALAKFAIEGIESNEDFDRFDRFESHWGAYFESTGFVE